MAWDAFHRREAVVQAALELAEQRRNGALPWDHLQPDATVAFGGPERLLGALQMRWHTRLSGAIERELADRPGDLETAVVHAWRMTAAQTPGLRSVLDAHADDPAMAAARRKDWGLLASASGVAGIDDPAAEWVGERIEDRARSVVVETVPPPYTAPLHRGDSLLRRLRHVLAA